MSATRTIIPDPVAGNAVEVKPLGAPNSANAPTTKADQAVSLARDIPSLIKQAAIVDPDLAAKWTGKSLVASKTIWGTLATMIVSWAVTKYGLGWSPEVCAEVSGVAVMVATAFLRLVTELPITGIFRSATTNEAVAIAAPAAPVVVVPATVKGP